MTTCSFVGLHDSSTKHQSVNPVKSIQLLRSCNILLYHHFPIMPNASDPTTAPEANSLAIDLIGRTNASIQSQPEHSRIAISQTKHRIDLLQAWFGSLEAAKNSLEGSTILEIGCGQGDMTVALAWAVGPSGTVNAIDPAPLDYGSPETLLEAQQRISRSPFGTRINWIRSDPIEALQRDPKLRAADYIILAHSLLYMGSTEYVATLFRALSSAASTATESALSPKLLVAEWGMRVSSENAKPHLYAVQAQAAQPLSSGNIEPKTTTELAREAGWKEEREIWIVSPDLDDGAWEVAAARSMPFADDANESAGRFLRDLSRTVVVPTRCMDVWAGAFYWWGPSHLQTEM
jgi:SAM-dependent methyltransferase